MSVPAADDTGIALTIAAATAGACARLAAAGVESPLRDTRLLLAAATGWPMGTLIAWPDRALEAAAAICFAGFVARRAAREPVSRILGRRGFWRHDFALGPGALDPRPDSELLVAEALRRLPPEDDGLVVDLGVGSGCLLLSVLAERPRMTGVGIDTSIAALRVAAANAEALGVAGRCLLLQGDWAQALGDGRAACLVTNPPYIPTVLIARLEPEVWHHDPVTALDGGPDGLVAYRLLAPQVRRLVRSDGFAVIEIGAAQADDVSGIMTAASLAVSPPLTDLGGRDRCIVATPAA